jgi:hypothetical protein
MVAWPTDGELEAADPPAEQRPSRKWPKLPAQPGKGKTSLARAGRTGPSGSGAGRPSRKLPPAGCGDPRDQG